MKNQTAENKFFVYDKPDGFPVDNCIFTIVNKESKHVRKSLPKQELKVLLIKRLTFIEPKPDYPEQGKWAFPGGMSFRNETIDEAALRVLKREANIKDDIYLEQFKTVYYPGRDPRGWYPTTIYISLLKEEYLQSIGSNEHAEEVGLFSINEIMEMELAFDHKEIILSALDKIRKMFLSTTIAKELLPKEFTIAQLLQIIKIVVPSFNVEKPNFIRKLVGTKNRESLLLESLDEKGEQKTSDEYSQRAAKLYHFNDEFDVSISIFNSTHF